ncbi:MAG: hypothetical protein D6814_11090 [Calditrichaeota bacterium]|nr:MAG: hypothetical protein D6814_11090 [Calditrichota bacterium]
MSKKLLIFLWLLPASLSAQDLYYYHTIHTSALSAAYGRTYRGQYTYQLSHRRQLKLTAIYIFDDFSQGRDRIKSDIYNANIQFQYNVIHFKRLFVNVSLGAGGYWLRSQDKLLISIEEKKVNFIGGVQLEYYLLRNNVAILGDFDWLYMPFSDIYEVLRAPAVGIALYF